MATLKFNRKPQISGVANVKVTNKGNKLLIRYTGFTGDMGSIMVDKNFRLRIEAKDCDIQVAKLSNLGIVIGDVQQAVVGNSLEVEGTVRNYQCPRGTISVDSSIKVVYGPELKARMEAQYGFRRQNLPVKVLRIDGKLMNLQVDASGIDIETVILGNIKQIEVGNSLEVKGNIQEAKVGNMISATMGYSRAKSTKELQRLNKQRHEEADSILGDLFRNFKI